MAQINFTLNYEFLVGLFSEDRNQAFGKLMEAIMNQVLKTESSEQLGAENYERNKERRDYRNGTRKRGLVIIAFPLFVRNRHFHHVFEDSAYQAILFGISYQVSS